MAAEKEERLHTACFTGHRPEKLTQPETEIVKGLMGEIHRAIEDGLYVFISGMARGVDIRAAEIVLGLRAEGKHVQLLCASPYEGVERGWNPHWQERYKAVLRAADAVRFICPHYSKSCFQMRNEWMVNHASRVIAVFNGQKSGTKNTIDYAKKMGVAVAYIEG